MNGRVQSKTTTPTRCLLWDCSSQKLESLIRSYRSKEYIPQASITPLISKPGIMGNTKPLGDSTTSMITYSNETHELFRLFEDSEDSPELFEDHEKTIFTGSGILARSIYNHLLLVIDGGLY